MSATKVTITSLKSGLSLGVNPADVTGIVVLCDANGNDDCQKWTMTKKDGKNKEDLRIFKNVETNEFLCPDGRHQYPHGVRTSAIDEYRWMVEEVAGHWKILAYPKAHPVKLITAVKEEEVKIHCLDHNDLDPSLFDITEIPARSDCTC